VRGVRFAYIRRGVVQGALRAPGGTLERRRRALRLLCDRVGRVLQRIGHRLAPVVDCITRTFHGVSREVLDLVDRFRWRALFAFGM